MVKICITYICSYPRFAVADLHRALLLAMREVVFFLCVGREVICSFIVQLNVINESRKGHCGSYLLQMI